MEENFSLTSDILEEPIFPVLPETFQSGTPVEWKSSSCQRVGVRSRESKRERDGLTERAAE